MDSRFKIIPFQGKGQAKSEAYLDEVRALSQRIHELSELHGMDAGNVLMDVTYLTVAQAICKHRDDS